MFPPPQLAYAMPKKGGQEHVPYDAQAPLQAEEALHFDTVSVAP